MIRKNIRYWLCLYFLTLQFVICPLTGQCEFRNNDQGNVFVSLWSTESAEINIRFTDGNYTVTVEKYDHGDEMEIWNYNCRYYAAQNTLIAEHTGTKRISTYDMDTDSEEEQILYQDGSALFFIDAENCLRWEDRVEDAGEGLQFQKMGNYCGQWRCENTVIDFYNAGGLYKCDIIMDEGNGLILSWDYFCVYEDATGNAVSEFGGKKERIKEDGVEEASEMIYDDGQAIFSIDSDGYLIWQDLKENIGNEWKFERLLLSDTAV